jgi:very-short-patch-repair endonuclease
MLYNEYDESGKKKLLQKLYLQENKSFQEIAELYHTYPNKIRRDAIKFKIQIRDKSLAQKNALKTGKHKHPTKGTKRSESTKTKIGQSIIQQWENMDDGTKKTRKEKAKHLWNSLSEDEKQERLIAANQAVRTTSKTGSKLEHYLLKCLINDNYKVEFHKEQILSNTKLQLDLFLPTMNIAIEIDGPSHFLPVWGEESLAKNQKYDRKKSGLIIGKGLKLIRIKQIHDFSNARAHQVYVSLKLLLDNKQAFANSNILEIED